MVTGENAYALAMRVGGRCIADAEQKRISEQEGEAFFKSISLHDM